jgi:hypothetical protein
MRIEYIKYIEQSSSSLTNGLYIAKDSWDYLKDTEEVMNYSFGKTEKDVIELEVYTLDDTLITGSVIKPSGETKQFTGSYKNIKNEPVTYSHTYFVSDLVIVGNQTQSLFFNISDELNNLSISDGNYKVYTQLTKDVVGSSFDGSRRLILDEISPSRTEIALIPSTDVNSVDERDIRFNIEYQAFGQGKLQVNQIIDEVLDGLKSPQIYNIYYKVKSENQVEAQAFLSNYGFISGISGSQDINAIKFITDVYYGNDRDTQSQGYYLKRRIAGIYEQYFNWLHENYNLVVSFQDLYDVYYSLFRFIIEKELDAINSYRPENYDGVINFLSEIYFTSIFYPIMLKAQVNYINLNIGYFKNYLSFDDGTLLPIMNVKIVQSTDPRFHDRLIIKLDSSLGKDIKVGSRMIIKNFFASPPIVQNVYFFTKNIINTILLRGPNFNIKVGNSGNSTETISSEELFRETGSLYNELFLKLNSKLKNEYLDTIDYRYFENFITFSSAVYRLNAYATKKEEITSLEQEVSELDEKLLISPGDIFYQKEKSQATNRINEIYGSFDGYENFLEKNPEWYSEHLNVYDTETSASLYDIQNQSGLINNLPEFINSGNGNEDYVTFVGMIGHYFDNLTVFIKQFTDKNNHDADENRGVSTGIADQILRSLGWEPEISKENLPLLLSSFSKSDFSPSSSFYNQVGSISETERNRIIWKRLLNSLPFIYKTKGTEASINAIISCFGIPKNLIKIKEYGGIDSLIDSSDKSYYIFENTKYEPYFSGSGEYFEASWTGSVQSVEFNLSFDEGKIEEENKIFYVAGCVGSWNIGAIRDRGKYWGRLFFTITDGSETKTVGTGKIPIFDGNTYNVLLRRNDPVPEFNLQSASAATIDTYPIQYDLIVKKADSSRIVYTSTGSIIISGSLNTEFRSGTNILFGDNWSGVTGSFWGSIDEIKLWEIPLDDSRFDNHVLYRGAYDLNSPTEMVESNLLHISFERPIDLYTSSGVFTLNNLSFRNDFPTFTANDFQPVYDVTYDTYGCPVSQSIYPYQFLQKNTRQTIQIPSYGAARFRSNKTNYVEQTLISPLSSESRSSLSLSNVTGKDSNKLGVFFSPIDIQNEEILKFFGQFEIGDLIGDPRTVYDRTYKKFEKFREIYFDQGLGRIDYQSFMNMVKSYFDKSMFSYIKTVVPARTKLVEGLMLEPHILERPKLELQPLVKQNINIPTGSVYNMGYGIAANKPNYYTQSIDIGNIGTTLLNDINHRQYADVPDVYGSVIYSDSGVTYYNGDYYRADILKVKKPFQIYRNYSLQGSELNDYEKQINIEGTAQTITRSYYEVSIAKLPVVTEYPLYIVIGASVSMSYSGSISFDIGANGITSSLQTGSHSLSGLLWDNISGIQTDQSPFTGIVQDGTITTPINITGSFVPNVSGSVSYNGMFSANFDSTEFYFSGSISFNVSPLPSQADRGYFDVSFLSSNSTGSIFEEFVYKTYGGLFGTANGGIRYRKQVSLENTPENSERLLGYFPTHYKYKKKVFSSKEINSYDQQNKPQKWKRGSQNKKTTVDEKTGLLNNSSPVETKAT